MLACIFVRSWMLSCTFICFFSASLCLHTLLYAFACLDECNAVAFGWVHSIACCDFPRVLFVFMSLNHFDNTVCAVHFLACAVHFPASHPAPPVRSSFCLSAVHCLLFDQSLAMQPFCDSCKQFVQPHGPVGTYGTAEGISTRKPCQTNFSLQNAMARLQEACRELQQE